MMIGGTITTSLFFAVSFDTQGIVLNDTAELENEPLGYLEL